MSVTSDGFVFHHMGIACRSIEEDRQTWLALGYNDEAPAFEDPVQGVRGLFMVGNGPRVELLENLAGSTTVSSWIKRGTYFYHNAYFVPDITAAIGHWVALGARVVVEPVPAIAFDNRKIAFLMLVSGQMIEFIEAP